MPLALPDDDLFTDRPSTTFNVSTHNGSITMYNPLTGQHRTVKVRTQKKDAKFAPGMRILSLLTGGDTWEQFAFVFPSDGDPNVKVWRSKKGHGGIPSIWERLCWMIAQPYLYDDRIDYKFEGACRVCNRPLTNPESIDSGIGPICAGRQGAG